MNGRLLRPAQLQGMTEITGRAAEEVPGGCGFPHKHSQTAQRVKENDRSGATFLDHHQGGTATKSTGVEGRKKEQAQRRDMGPERGQGER